MNLLINWINEIRAIIRHISVSFLAGCENMWYDKQYSKAHIVRI